MPDDQTRRKFLTGAGAGVAAAVAGCAGGEPTQTETGTPTSSEMDGTETTETTSGTDAQTGGTLRTAITGKIESLDPVIKGTGGVNQWSESLMDYENGKLPPIPGLAESVETIDNGKEYRFTLREGVTFHDGTEFDSKDVVYSWERAAGSKNTQNADDIIGGTFTVEHEKQGGEELSNYVDGSLQVRAPDPQTFEFTMREPYFGALFQIASESTFNIIPENTVGDISRDDVKTDGKYSYQEAFGTKNGGPKVAGTGPFQVETWSKGDVLEMVRYDDYYGEVAKIDGVQQSILSGTEAAYQRALNGNLDIFEVPGSKFQVSAQQGLESIGQGRQVGEYQLENGTTVNHAQIEELGADTIIFHCEKVPRVVRRAFAMILNLEDIAQNVYPNQKPAYNYTPRQIFPNLNDQFDTPADAYDAFYQNGEGTQLGVDLTSDGYPWGIGEARLSEAQQMIEDANLSDEQKSYTFTIASGDTVFQTLAQRLQQKAKSIGIDLTIQSASYGSLISKGIFEGAYDMWQLGDTAEVPAPDNLLRFYPTQTANNQATRWGTRVDDDDDPTDPNSWENEVQQKVAEMWEANYLNARAPTEENQTKRNKAYLAVEEGIWYSCQIIPTAQRVTREWWSKDIDYTPPSIMGDKTYNTVTINRDN
ncbi:MAG: ABC transporter substrate-binding protein [Halobaculum sp.]